MKLPHAVILLTSLLILLPPATAAPPLPFQAEYEARYRGVNASAGMSLAETEAGRFRFSQTVDLRVFGISLSSIDETSDFTWVNDTARPLRYSYEQSGLGSRSRSADFDWDAGEAVATVDGNSTTLALGGRVYDELSMYMELRKRLAAGSNNITLSVVDGHVIEAQTFRVVERTRIETPLGRFDAVRVERVRDDSSRVTEYWFAENWNHLLLRLYQRDPDGEEYEINVSGASLDGEAVTPLAGDARQ